MVLRNGARQIGDDDIPYEKALTDIKTFVAEHDKMISQGRFVFSFSGLDHHIRTRIAIEKYAIRKRIIGTVYGFRAEISIADTRGVVGYLISNSLPDLNSKIYGIIVQKLEHKLLDDSASISAMSSW